MIDPLITELKASVEALRVKHEAMLHSKDGVIRSLTGEKNRLETRIGILMLEIVKLRAKS